MVEQKGSACVIGQGQEEQASSHTCGEKQGGVCAGRVRARSARDKDSQVNTLTGATH